ncbi:MAG: hypothetical protein WCG25_05005 [bacterium]
MLIILFSKRYAVAPEITIKANIIRFKSQSFIKFRSIFSILPFCKSFLINGEKNIIVDKAN